MADTVKFTQFDAGLMVTYDAEASKLLGMDYWRVTQGFRYYIGAKDSNRWVDVPAGYLTDGASVPKIFWGFIPPWGSYGQAAVVHDLLCEYLEITVDGVKQSITRAEADQILLEAMVVLNVPEVTRTAISGAVDAYRIVARVSQPTVDPAKRTYEAKWGMTGAPV